MALVIAIDAGTTGCRVIGFDQELHILAQYYEEVPQYHPQPGWVEQDPRDILRIVRSGLRQVIEKLPEAPAAIGIANQRETVAVWDADTGEPLHNAIVWQCRRTADYCGKLRKAGYEALIRERTGLVVDPYFSATKLRWILDHVPGARSAADAGCLRAGTVDTWLVERLTGDFATDPSNACRTLLYRLDTGSWDAELLHLFGISQAMLPTILSSDAHFGDTRAEEVGAVVPIHAVLGDQQAALFSHGGWDPNVVKNTYGTGLFMMRSTGHELAKESDLLRTVAWHMNDRSTYALEGAAFIGGAAMQWLRDGLGILADVAESATMARRVPDNGGVYFVPALVGLGAPWWDPHARGTLIGMTQGSKADHVVRAVLESMAYQTRALVDAMGPRPARMRVDGGATANDFLMQFQADLLGIPVERPRILESTALGAAAAAGIAANVWSRESFYQAHRVERVFEPATSDVDVDALFATWQEAVSRSRSWATS